MNRLVPYRAKVSEEMAARIEQTLNTTMYLVQTPGPTSYVIQEQNCEKKHKVLIGSMQTCSCGTADICIHILFVMLKVLRVPPTTPVVWQKSLIDSEIDMLLGGGYRKQARPLPKPYMKKRKENVTAAEPTDADVDRHELVEGEVCAICQEDMEGTQPLTFCRKGCGNNFHIECMKVFGESRRQSKENIVCPLCRQDWGGGALSTLRKEIDVANRAPNVHKGVSCRKCKTKPLRCERYRCVQCKNVDLCARCFKTNAHLSHAFVMKQNARDPWIPALRETQPRTAISSDLIRELETRELSTNDYDVLLQLDHGHKHPLQDFLVEVVSGTKVNADNAKMFGESGGTCSLCAQSLRIKAALHSTICGHVFHESCLARSILSQVYSCPFPGCNHALLPGLLYLQKKCEKKTEQPTDPEHIPHRETSALNASFTVLGLQQKGFNAQSPRTTNLRVSSSSSRSSSRQQNHHENDKFSPLPDLISLPTTHHETLESAPALNQIEHESVVLPSLTLRNAARSSTIKTKGKLFKRSRARNDLPPAPIDLHQLRPPFSISNSLTEERLNQAEQIRAELKAVEKERLRRQRLVKEERRQRHKENNNMPAFAGGFLSPDNMEGDRLANLQVSRTRHNNVLKRKQKQDGERNHNQLPIEPITLPDLFIGNRR